MLKLLRFLFTGDAHLHQWEIIKEIDLYEKPNKTMPYARKYVTQCKICGSIKATKI